MKPLSVTSRAGRHVDGFPGFLLYLSALHNAPQAWPYEVILSDIKGCVSKEQTRMIHNFI